MIECNHPTRSREVRRVAYVEVEKDIRVFVEDVNPNAGQPVLFLHGWPVSHNMFEYQFDQLPKHGFRCIGMDQRGFGKSDRPWHGYSYDRLADDVHAVISALRLENLALVGHSTGGAIAVRYMARYSGDRVAKLALVSSATPSVIRRVDYPFGFTVTQVSALIEQIYADRPKAVSDFGRMFFARAVSEEFRNWFNGLAWEASGHATAMIPVSWVEEDLRSDLLQIHAPTGVFHGVFDEIIPFQSALMTHQAIKGSQLFPFERSGHGVFYDELERFNSCLVAFLSSPQ